MLININFFKKNRSGGGGNQLRMKNVELKMMNYQVARRAYTYIAYGNAV